MGPPVIAVAGVRWRSLPGFGSQSATGRSAQREQQELAANCFHSQERAERLRIIWHSVVWHRYWTLVLRTGSPNFDARLCLSIPHQPCGEEIAAAVANCPLAEVGEVTSRNQCIIRLAHGAWLGGDAGQARERRV